MCATVSTRHLDEAVKLTEDQPTRKLRLDRVVDREDMIPRRWRCVGRDVGVVGPSTECARGVRWIRLSGRCCSKQSGESDGGVRTERHYKVTTRGTASC